ncbi:hypothetical protein [Sporichthya sp.]|uniref:hypothetical protein n=1 Tax=Sporichthya sp. TaxID=65475 RepID=UPI00178FADCC|nr:hypothetical protein [Sporichthya sp.]MBA3742859.1 hypothetical protein [Sporichthya sp.]
MLRQYNVVLYWPSSLTAIPTGLAPAQINAWVRERAAAGVPMYELDRTALAALKPDLVLTQDLCRVCALPAGTVEDAGRAIGTDAAVLSLDPRCLSDVFFDIEAVAKAAGAAAVADRLAGVPLRAIDSATYVVQAGPGLVDGIEALAWAFHPDAVPPPPPGRIASAG